MTEKLREHLEYGIDTEMGEKKAVSYTNVRHKGFINLHSVAAIELPDFKDFTLFYENGKCYAIPLTYRKENVQIITDDEHVAA